MPDFDKCNPEFARELLQNHHKECNRIEHSMERCKRLIEDRNDYSFLHELGYSVDNADSFQDAYDVLLGEAYFLEILLVPFMRFLREVPKASFYDNDTPLFSRIISESDFFHLLLELDSKEQEEYLQRLVKRSDSLELLRKSIQEKDEALFLSTLKTHQIYTTRLGQFLNTVHNLENKPTVYSDIINAASTFQEATTISIPLPSVIPFFKDKNHYLTKKNCITSFVSAWQSVESLFSLTSAEMYGLYKLSLADKLPYRLNYALSVFFNEESFGHLLTFLKGCGFLDALSENSIPEDTPVVTSHELRPLAKPPRVFSEDENGEAKCRAFFMKMVRSKAHWFREEDLECFLYLMNVSETRPRFLHQIIWFGDKYELKCLMEILYPNRKRKEKPDYGDMNQIFCDKDGRSFNLKNTPLQCRMNHITSPEQAAKEVRIMKRFARFAGVM